MTNEEERTSEKPQVKNAARARQRLLSLIAADKLRFLTLVISELLSSSISLYYAFCSKNLIDAATGGEMPTLVKAALVYGIMILLRTALGTFITTLAERLCFRKGIKLRQYYLDVIESRSYAEISTWHSGILMDRISSDVDDVCDGLVYLLPGIIDRFFKLVSAFIALFFFDTRLPILLALAGVLVFLGAHVGGSRLKEAWRKNREIVARKFAFIQEMLSNLLVLKCFQSEKKVNAYALRLEEENYSTWRKWFRLNIFYSTASGMFFDLGYLIAIVICAFSIHVGSMSFGGLTAVLQLVTKVQSPITGLSGKYPQYLNLLLAMERLLELEDLPEEKRIALTDIDKVYAEMSEIRGADLSFAYAAKPVLDGASFSFRKGEFSLLSGVSGEGKSTLMKLLLGVYQNYSGELYLAMNDEKLPLDGGTRQLFAYVPQGNQLLSGTIYESLTFFNDERTSDEIAEALRISCADKFIAEMPDGLQSKLGEDGLGLSEGQAQRIAIARALLSRAPILLLDEATSALDEQTEYTLLKNLKEMKDKTLIFITHKKAAYDICDVEWHLENGQMNSRRLR